MWSAITTAYDRHPEGLLPAELQSCGRILANSIAKLLHVGF